MSGYNCKIEYIAGTENTCADLLSWEPNGECTDPILEPFELDINDNTFEVGMINSNEMDPKEFASCQVPEKESLEVPECELPGFNMVQEQSKNSEILELKSVLAHGDHPKQLSADISLKMTLSISCLTLMIIQCYVCISLSN